MPEPDDGKATLDSGQLASGRVSGRETPQGSISLPHSPLSLLPLFLLLLVVVVVVVFAVESPRIDLTPLASLRQRPRPTASRRRAVCKPEVHRLIRS